MKIQLTTTQHLQSGKTVNALELLGETFIYSDKRGFSRHEQVSIDFAKKLIESFEAKKGHFSGKPISFPERLREGNVVLSWVFICSGKEVELKLHSYSQHVWSSIVSI